MEPNATVTITHRSGSRDQYGDLNETGTTTTSARALFAPEAADELNEPGRRGTVTAGTLYLLETAAIDFNDDVTVDGTTFTVIGMPQPWNAPGGSFRGIVAQLRRTEG